MPGLQAEHQHHHRRTIKPNKSFKGGKHASKSAQRDAAKGRIERTKSSSKSSNRHGAKESQSKANRRNTAKQIQANKRALAVDAVRGKESRAPRTISIINMSEDGDPLDLLKRLGAVQNGSIWHLDLSEPRPCSLRFLISTDANLTAPIISDGFILYMSGSVEVSAREENLLRFITSLAIPPDSVRLVIHSLPESSSPAASTRKSLLSFVNHFVPDVKRSFDVDNLSPLLCTLANGKLRDVNWRQGRARMLVEDFQPADNGVYVTGYIKGGHLSANRLVHIVDAGDFEVEKVIDASLHKGKKSKVVNDTDAMDIQEISPVVLSSRIETEADDLQSYNELAPDADVGEQTWPADEDIPEGDIETLEAERTRREAEAGIPAPADADSVFRRVPKGTSRYQAAWIVDDDEDEDSKAADNEITDESEDEDMTEDEEPDDDGNVVNIQDDDEIDASEALEKHVDFDDDMERKEYDKYLENQRLEREERDDLEFPDEIDTPVDVPARTRFARFRGLKSLRTSYWDPYENLPSDYSQCFMFEDWNGMGHRLQKRARSDGVPPGERVTLKIKGMDYADMVRLSEQGLIILFNLYKHEHKYSVMNFTIQRNTEYEGSVRSKSPLIVHVGPRSYEIKPIYSQHTQANGGKGRNNVHKFERYLRHGVTSVATAYLPITFGRNTPAVFTTRDGTLVGNGSVLSADPTRIITKRYVLTGHPYKVHRKTATIRYMFFNSDDVRYFKPIELHTKKGRTGHIKESLGTHGYYKAGFDGPIDQMDTICLNLYKRCFPKWGTQIRSVLSSKSDHGDDNRDVDMSVS